jgi:ribosomal protein S18 acetylase RimI-like enzyme
MNELRSAVSADATVIAQLVNKAYRPQGTATGWTHESALVSGDRTTAEQVVELLAKPYSIILVGLENGEIIACIHIEKHGHSSHIGMLAVCPSLQATGVGKQILVFAEQFAKSNFTAEKFVMQVMSSRIELIDFYLRRGYHKTGVLLDYPIAAGVGVPIYPGLTLERLEKPAA